jgi:chemotaxis protein methyltransferase CheR
MSLAALKPQADAASLVEGEFAFTAKDFERIRAILYEDAGIYLPEAKTALVYSRLAKRLRRLKLPSFKDYVALISSDAGKEERRELLAALTTNVTRFFREPHHFEHLARQLALWAPRARAGERIRIWSAGCSTGPEPYSIAMTLLEAIPDAASLDVKILATDIDPVVIARARAGLCTDEAAEEIPADSRSRWLLRQGDGWRIAPNVRELVTFNELNLMAAWPMRHPFQAVFCRNVAIYFDAPTQARLWSRFADAMTRDGRLYIGHSERASEPRLESDGLTVYRLKEARP